MSPEIKLNQSENRKKALAIPSLTEVMDSLEQQTVNNPPQYNLFRNNIGALMDYYNAVYFAATGRGYRKLNKFRKELDKGESSIYNSEQVKFLKPQMEIIRSKVYGPISKRKK
jgi:hypothetical protein